MKFSDHGLTKRRMKYERQKDFRRRDQNERKSFSMSIPLREIVGFSELKDISWTSRNCTLSAQLVRLNIGI
jgi:hypothetical protein